MYDGLLWAVERAKAESTILQRLQLVEKQYLLATVHRAENTDDPARLRDILAAFNALAQRLVFPVHPRTRLKIEDLDWQPGPHIRLIEPVGYLDMVRLCAEARLILTVSGGLQKEAFRLRTPCVTLRNETEWLETVQSGWNILAVENTEQIVSSANILLTNTPVSIQLGINCGGVEKNCRYLSELCCFSNVTIQVKNLWYK
jgi:UDP-GlcNAc3NAcA epimerase